MIDPDKDPKSPFERDLDERAKAAGPDAVLRLGRIKTEAALRMEQLKAGILPIPPLEIEGKELKIMELYEDGAFSIDGIRFFESIEKEIRSGKNRISLRIPGDAAVVWNCVRDKSPGVKDTDRAMRETFARSIELQMDEDRVARVKVSVTLDDHGITDGSQTPPPDYLFTIVVLERVNPN